MTAPLPAQEDAFSEVWTTRDGLKLKVSEMDESHVRAALCMVIRRGRLRNNELMRRQLMDYEIRCKHDVVMTGDGDDYEVLNTCDASVKGSKS